MDGLVILVEFKLKPGMRDAFLSVVKPDAEASVSAEPGCRRFDILLPEGEPDVVWLYEIYADAAAIDHHMETPHLKAFRHASADLVERVTVRRCAQIEHAKS